MPTVAALQEYLERLLVERDARYEARFVAAEQAVRAAITASDKAIDKSEAEGAEWRRGANEWRGAMGDRERQFVPRTEATAETRRLNEKLDELAGRVTRTEGVAQGSTSTTALLLAVAGVVLTIIMAAVAILALNG